MGAELMDTRQSTLCNGDACKISTLCMKTTLIGGGEKSVHCVWCWRQV